MSTEPIAQPTAPGPDTCSNCGAPLAGDQRYCLECGERQTPMSSVLRAGPATRSATPQTQPAAGAHPSAGYPPTPQRSNALTVIAGVGVLLLAMGVGVLIGRSSVSKSSSGPPQVISVASGGAGGAPATTAPAASEAAFTSDWPSGTNGYTVQLQAVPTSSPVSAVEAAKTSATGKGAKSVGALKSDEFSGLAAGSYIIYSGVYHKKAEADKALAGLKSKFAGAKVIHVAAGGGSASSPQEEKAEEAKEAKEGKGVGQSLNKPAPPSSVESLKTVKGKSYEEKSKNLPNVISTG